MIRLAVTCGLLFAVLGGNAQGAEPTPSPSPATSVELGGSTERLSNGLQNWTSEYVTVTRQFAPRKTLYASLTNDSRFGQTDQTYLAGAYIPLTLKTTVNVEGSFSPTHAILPRDEIAVSLEHRLPDGWGYAVGLRHRSYTSVDVDLGSLQVDRYWKTFRAAYALTAAQLSNAPGTSLSHALLLTHYYGNEGDNSLTFSVNAGREVENTGTNIVVSAVTGASLRGVQWFSQSFGFSWTISSFRQGLFYTRSGVQIGVRGRF